VQVHGAGFVTVIVSSIALSGCGSMSNEPGRSVTARSTTVGDLVIGTRAVVDENTG
jgi:hypothetical protein